MENTPLDPRITTATSASANDEDDSTGSDGTGEPKALTITSASSDPKMFTLPWSEPLAQWPEDLLVNLPRGISRHVVRFVRVGEHIYAMKEITRSVAEREYETLRQLEKLDIPAVKPIAVVTGRHDAQGEELEAMLVTEHLKFSLPYRALFARNLRDDTAQRLIDALAVLMVRLHLIGFYWGDVSLSNVLFLRDADEFSAFLVDAETGELYPKLTDGQREYDIDLARTNIIGELMDLNSGNLLPTDVDEIEVGDRLVDRYHKLWEALTGVSTFKPNEIWRIENRVNKLNELGFDVDELEVKTTPDGNSVTVRPRVVDAGYSSRKLMRLTGLDVQENQARRLLNDLEAYRMSTWRQDEDLEIVATDWMREVFEPTVRMIPPEYRSQIEPAQFFHEVLTHRWYLGEKMGRDVPMDVATQSYIDEYLKDYRIDTQVMRAINMDADSGVIDDEKTYGDNSDIVGDAGADGDEDDQDASVWSQDLSDFKQKPQGDGAAAGGAGGGNGADNGNGASGGNNAANGSDGGTGDGAGDQGADGADGEHQPRVVRSDEHVPDFSGDES